MNLKMIHGFEGNKGGREHYEDYSETQEITTKSGLILLLGVVADGVGGVHKGEVAAQNAVEAFFEYITQSKELTIPKLLTNALAHSAKIVNNVYKQTKGASTTIAVAAVNTKNNKLYIANIGDSRIYLVRKKKLTLLTMDHNFSNMMSSQGKLSRKIAENNPKAKHLMRALGPTKDMPVDIGFYVNTQKMETARKRGLKGLKLEMGDSILICSDGITDENNSGIPFVNEKYIIGELDRYEGQAAAKRLVNKALSNKTTDNATAAILQVYDPNRKKLLLLPWKIAGAIGLFLTIMVAVFSSQLNSKTTQLNSSNLASTEEIYRITQTFEARPNATERPPLKPGEVAQLFPGIIIYANQEVSVVEDSLITVSHQESEQIFPSQLFIKNGTELEFDFVQDNNYQIRLYPGFNIFLTTGQYKKGVSIISENSSGQFNVNLKNDNFSCMSLETKNNQIMASCYQGDCSFEIGDKIVQIREKKWTTFDLNYNKSNDGDITPSNRLFWLEHVKQFDQYLASHAWYCLDIFAPTPTPTVTPTNIPTETSVPTLTPIIQSTPIPVATNTPSFVDSDNDGVEDDSDACADTPGGATVDSVGCPSDSDGDGVWDGLDQCSGTPNGANVGGDGCQFDDDGDGVVNESDSCPGTPGGAIVDWNGCQFDDDGDGVVNESDSCPGTPGGASVDENGCKILSVLTVRNSQEANNDKWRIDIYVNGGVDPEISLNADPGGNMDRRNNYYRIRIDIEDHLNDCPCTIKITASDGATISITVDP